MSLRLVGWHEAWEDRIDTCNWWKTPTAFEYATDQLVGVKGGVVELLENGETLSPRRAGKYLALNKAAQLEKAQTFWIEPDMCSLIEHAAKSFETAVLTWDDLPAPSGFIELGKRWKSYSVEEYGGDVDIYVTAIAWRYEEEIKIERTDEVVPGISLDLYCTKTDYADLLRKDTNIDIDEIDFNVKSAGIPKLIPAHTAAWGMGIRYDDPRYLGPNSTNYVDVRKYVHTLFTMLQQRIASRQIKTVPRQVYRGAKRKFKAAPSPEIEVVVLRRSSNPYDKEGDSGDGIDWTHRWMVDGHWRNQWYPGLNSHKRIWIAPHVKGPEDKPLWIKDKVYSLER